MVIGLSVIGSRFALSHYILLTLDFFPNKIMSTSMYARTCIPVNTRIFSVSR